MSRLVTDIRTDEHVNILLWFCEQNSQYLWYMIKGRVQKKVWSFAKPPSTSLAARLESKSVCVAYVTQRIFWRCIVSIREWADSFLIAVSLALRVLKENGAAIWPHRKSGGPWRLHETLHRGKCRGYHGASGQCLPPLPPKKILHRTLPFDMRAPANQSMTESGQRSQLTGTCSILSGVYKGTRVQAYIYISRLVGSSSQASMRSSGNWTRLLEPVVMGTLSTSMTTSW